MEFRSDLDENAPFSLAAELELLSDADMFVGNMGSHTSRMLYMKMIRAARTAVLPPFISVDGYGLCYIHQFSVGVSAHVRPLPACCPSGSSQREPYAVLPKLCCIYCCSAQYTQLS